MDREGWGGRAAVQHVVESGHRCPIVDGDFRRGSPDCGPRPCWCIGCRSPGRSFGKAVLPWRRSRCARSRRRVASRSSRGPRGPPPSSVFSSFLLLERVAVDADGERLSSSVLAAPILCCWRRLAASVAGPGALGGSSSRSSSESVDVVVRSSIFNVGISITQVENPRLTMVMSEIKTLMKR